MQAYLLAPLAVDLRELDCELSKVGYLLALEPVQIRLQGVGGIFEVLCRRLERIFQLSPMISSGITNATQWKQRVAETHLGNVVAGLADICPSGGFGINIHHPTQAMLDGIEQAKARRRATACTTTRGSGRGVLLGESLSLALPFSIGYTFLVRLVLTAASGPYRATALERFFQPPCFPFGTLQTFELVLLMFESVLDELVLDVFLMTERKAGFK